MKRAYVKAPYIFQLREVDKPKIKPGYGIIRVRACGICGSDIKTGRDSKDFVPIGHEMSGIVEEIQDELIKIGDQVVIESSSYCGRCSQCRNGKVFLCENWIEIEYCGFSEYIIVPIQSLVRFNSIDFNTAALTEPLGVALDLVYSAEIFLGAEVLIIGPGPIGLMVVKLCKILGARRVYLAGRAHSKARFEAGIKLGADDIIFTDKKEELAQKLKGKVDRVLLTAPPSLIPDSIEILRYGGITSYIGVGDGGLISFNADEFHWKKLQLRAPDATPALYFPQALKLLEDEIIDLKILISHIFPLAQIEEAFKLLRNNKKDTIKIVINP